MVSERVLILLENEPVPSDTRVWWEAQVLTDAGYDVTVVCPQGNGAAHADERAPYERRDGVTIHRYPVNVTAAGARGHLSEYRQAAVRITQAVLRLGRRQRFGVVHACNPPDFLLLTALPLKARGSRFLFDHHDLSPELLRDLYRDGSRLLHGATRLLERLTFRLADVVVSTNESYRRIAIERGRKDPDDVFVVRNAPDPARFRPRAGDPLLRGDVAHLLAYVGVIGPQDGVQEALRALALLRRRRQDWSAIFAGAGSALDDVRRLALDLELDDCVEFLGFVDQEEVVRVLASSDVCLSPEPATTYNHLSSWMKLTEYMAMAKPTVCYDLAESRRTAREAALYAQPGADEDYAACIDMLLDDPGWRRAMGAAGRARLCGELSRGHAEAALLAAYEQALGRPV